MSLGTSIRYIEITEILFFDTRKKEILENGKSKRESKIKKLFTLLEYLIRDQDYFIVKHFSNVLN